MSDKHRKHFERGARVSAHCASYPEDFPSNSVAGAALAHRIPSGALRRGFGVLLIVFSVYFVSHQLLTG